MALPVLTDRSERDGNETPKLKGRLKTMINRVTLAFCATNGYKFAECETVKLPLQGTEGRLSMQHI